MIKIEDLARPITEGFKHIFVDAYNEDIYNQVFSKAFISEKKELGGLMAFSRKSYIVTYTYGFEFSSVPIVGASASQHYTDLHESFILDEIKSKFITYLIECLSNPLHSFWGSLENELYSRINIITSGPLYDFYYDKKGYLR